MSLNPDDAKLSTLDSAVAYLTNQMHDGKTTVCRLQSSRWVECEMKLPPTITFRGFVPG